MGARTKLNTVYINGGLVLAAMVGWATHSWAVFLIVLMASIAGSWLSGDIRPGGRG